MSSIQVFVKKLHPEAILPRKSTEGAACFDLFSIEDKHVYPHEVVGTGIAVDIPENFVGLIFPRSGIAFNNKVTLTNCTGIIDPDFRGEIKLALTDLSALRSTGGYSVSKGDKIAQIMFVELPQAHLVETDRLSETERGEGGLGSTGR